jgi:hypothetical protein
MSDIYYLPEAISFCGSGQAIYGIYDAYQGNILNGMGQTLIGMNLMKLGFILYSSVQTPLLMKISLCANNAMLAVKGIGNVAQGIRDDCLRQTAKGVGQVIFGVAATAAIASLDDKLINRASMISSCVGLTLSHILNCKEDYEGNKKWKAVVSLVNVLASIALITYVVFDTYNGLNCTPYPHSERTLSQQQCELFVESHQNELNQIYETKSASGNWTRIAGGKSKVAFIHPELPHGIIKVSTGSGRTDDDLKLQFDNVQYAKNIVAENKYKHIIIPDSYLIPFKNDNVLCETKFEFDPYPSFDSSRDAWVELNDFLEKSGFCDIFIWLWSNAAFLKGGRDIGVYDFDCKWEQILHRRLIN